jgi:DNA-binding NtrC family response regulator
MNHHWPGNVRELQNVIERAVILCGESGCLELEHLGMVSTSSSSPKPPMATPPVAGPAMPISSGEQFPSLNELEKQHVMAAIARSGGNRTQAARMLGISVRTLRNKLHEYRGGSGSEEEASGGQEAQHTEETSTAETKAS